MKTYCRWLLVWSMCGVVSVAAARDDRVVFPIKDAMARDGSLKTNPDDDVSLYFGDQATPKVLKTFNVWTVKRSTSRITSDDQRACEVAFMSAANALREFARKDGANAVINIQSVHGNRTTNSDTEYVCGSGNVAAGVELKGTTAKTVK